MPSPSRNRAGSESDLYPLVEAVYEAAVRPDAWSDFLGGLCAAVGAQSSCLQIYNSQDNQGDVLWSHGIPGDALARYPEWISQNPHLKAIAPYARTGLIVSNTPVARHDFLRSEFFNGYSRIYFPTYAAGGGVVYGNGPTQVTLAVDRATELESFDLSEGSVFSLLMPHLQRAMVVHKRLADAELDRATSLDALDRLDFGVVLLSRQGLVAEMNASARALVAEGQTLSVDARGRLNSHSEAGCDELYSLVASACNGKGQSLRPGGGSLSLARGDGRAPLEMMVSPLRLREVGFANEPPAAVLFLRDPERSVMPVARLQELYRLTLAEARVAQRLRNGESVTEIGDSLMVSVATVRTHVRRLLEKLGAKSISDLTRRIAGIPPVK